MDTVDFRMYRFVAVDDCSDDYDDGCCGCGGGYYQYLCGEIASLADLYDDW